MTPELQREGEATIARLEQILDAARRETPAAAQPHIENFRRSVINARTSFTRLIHCTPREKALQ